jgi:penicillin amidase
MCGKIPIRKKGQGTVPVPGWIKDYEWEGYIPFWDLPQGYNPSTHLIATANNKVISDSYPYLITHDWSSPFRVRRIVELLSKKKKLNINDFKEIHGDFVSMAVKEILPFLLNIEPENELQKTVQNSLLEWDHELASDSLPALIYEVWINKLAQNVLLDKIGEPLFKRINNSSSIINLLKYLGSYWFTGESKSNEVNRDKIILKSLDDALTEIKRRLGENLENWRWGKFHTLSFSHALSSIHGMSEIFDRGPFEMGGDRTTVNLTWFDSSIGYKQSRGVSYRQIIDLDEFSKSLSVHTLGQSGHPFNTHYDDMIQLWINLEYHPMLWGKNEVIQNMESKLILYPDL